MRLIPILLLALAAPLAAQDPPITIERHWLETVPPDHAMERYTRQVRLTLRIRNETWETIHGWGAMAVFLDPSGEELFRTRLSNAEDIPARRTRDVVYRWDDNEFFDDQPFDRLTAHRADLITIILEDVGVDREP